MSHLPVAVTTLKHFNGLSLPRYESALAAGMDLLAAYEQAATVQPGARVLVPTGICIGLPSGWELQIRPRSGLAIKNGLTCLNSPGTIDADYRGEIKVIIANLGQEAFTIERGMRIAQAVLAPVFQVAWQQVEQLDETARGSAGFGSTGVDQSSSV